MRSKVTSTGFLLAFGRIALVVIFLPGLASMIGVRNPESNHYISIEEQLNRGGLTVAVLGSGGHSGNCVHIKLENNTPDTLWLKLEPGRRLTSVDTELQDIFIVKERSIILPPRLSANLSGYGFCCQSSNKSPKKDTEFSIGYMAPTEWVRLAEVINQNTFPESAVQAAVWTMSDNHAISSIHAEDMQAITLLRQTVADIKGEVLPWYTITYLTDTSMVFSGKPDKLYGEIYFYLNANAMVSLYVRNDKGMLVRTLINESTETKGKNAYQLEVDIKGWKKGGYTIYLYQDNAQLVHKWDFSI